ncbi:cytosolic iron-sulfur assembly component 2A-like [Physella acuta]|uniref:cytosolic iron-sulfur assembly component 2A-like n=1 Tax=Physella acuta TaxID=109671 RepID=UPI0027DC53D3|nr:cytosolic iron-sulfur assembly component 2A-like [Physella acuta]
MLQGETTKVLTRYHLKNGDNRELKTLRGTIYDLISAIRDPEKPDSLEDLNVVSESGIEVFRMKTGQLMVRIELVPTVPHCNLASIIGLSMRPKLNKCLPEKVKVDIYIKEGTHETANEINKQINDKERISAAMENPNLQRLVNDCIEES